MLSRVVELAENEPRPAHHAMPLHRRHLVTVLLAERTDLDGGAKHSAMFTRDDLCHPATVEHDNEVP